MMVSYSKRALLAITLLAGNATIILDLYAEQSDEQPELIEEFRAPAEKDENRWAETVLRSEEGRIYIPRPTSPDVMLMSRFLAKIAIECLALKLI